MNGLTLEHSAFLLFSHHIFVVCRAVRENDIILMCLFLLIHHNFEKTRPMTTLFNSAWKLECCGFIARK